MIQLRNNSEEDFNVPVHITKSSEKNIHVQYSLYVQRSQNLIKTIRYSGTNVGKQLVRQEIYFWRHLSIILEQVNCNIHYITEQSGPTFSSLWPRISLPAGPKGQETPPDTIFGN